MRRPQPLMHCGMTPGAVWHYKEPAAVDCRLFVGMLLMNLKQHPHRLTCDDGHYGLRHVDHVRPARMDWGRGGGARAGRHGSCEERYPCRVHAKKDGLAHSTSRPSASEADKNAPRILQKRRGQGGGGGGGWLIPSTQPMHAVRAVRAAHPPRDVDPQHDDQHLDVHQQHLVAVVGVRDGDRYGFGGREHIKHIDQLHQQSGRPAGQTTVSQAERATWCCCYSCAQCSRALCNSPYGP